MNASRKISISQDERLREQTPALRPKMEAAVPVLMKSPGKLPSVCCERIFSTPTRFLEVQRTGVMHQPTLAE